MPNISCKYSMKTTFANLTNFAICFLVAKFIIFLISQNFSFCFLVEKFVEFLISQNFLFVFWLKKSSNF